MPSKAIAVHVRGYFQFKPPTDPPHMALINFRALTEYFKHLKSTMKYSATTIADKLRALRQAIEYVQYQNAGEAGTS